MRKSANNSSSKIISALVMISVIAILILAGPAQALILNLNIQDNEAGQGQTITFTGTIQVDSGEYPDIDKLNLRLEGPMNVLCQFDVNGTIISGCTGLTIQKISSPTYNYGYGGFDSGTLKYKFTLNTTSYSLGTYQTFLDVLISNVVEETNQGSDIEIKVIDLTIIAPESANYDSKYTNIKLLSSIKAKSFWYSDNGKSFRDLCWGQESCEGKRTFSDGWHNLTIKAIYDGGIEIEKVVTFFIDSTSPKIISSTPRRNTVVSTDFEVIYTEQNLQEITLYIENATNTKEFTTTSCPSGESQKCSFNDPNLEGMNKQTLRYWFKLKDSLNTVESSKISITSDLEAPQMTIFSPTTQSNYVTWTPINISVDKEVYMIEYKDHNDRDVWRELRTNTNEYGFDYTIIKEFKKGQQNLTFRVRDQFERTDTQNVIFNVS
jgi:hypothetical protein